MREVLLSVGAALLLLNFACTQNEGDATGSTGLSCNGTGTAPACFAWNPTVTACFVGFPGFPVSAPEPVPASFVLNVQSGQGSAYCTTPGTLGDLAVVFASRNDASKGEYQVGTLEVSDSVLSCGNGAAVSSSFAYYPKAYGASIFDIDLSNRANFTAFLDPADPEMETFAQFCYETETSGTYRLTSEDGSQQNGTWTN